MVLADCWVICLESDIGGPAMTLVAPWRLLYRALPAPLAQRARQRLPPGVTTTRFSLPGGEVVVLDDLGAAEFLKEIFWRGFAGYEAPAVTLFYALAKDAKVIFDVGSYLGYYALVAAKSNPSATIHSFEPLGDSAELQRHYLALNDCRNVVLHNLAVGGEEGTVEFFLPDRSISRLPNIGSLKNRFQQGETFSDRSFRTISTEVVTLDRFVEEHRISRVDLIKIDVEELEHDVVLGGQACVERDRPDIIAEILVRRPEGRMLAELLGGMGYGMYDIGVGGLHSIDDFDEMTNTRMPAEKQFGEIFFSCRSEEEISRVSRVVRSLPGTGAADARRL